MDSRNKLTMCRLCLCENEFFIQIFELNDWQGYVAAEVISDLLQFQVSETDSYPHVVCSTCLTKLTDFKLFKESCQNSKVMYDNMFTSSDSLMKHQSEMMELVTVKAEPIYFSENEHNVSKASNNLDVTDEFIGDPLEDIDDGVRGSELCDEDPLSETSPDVQFTLSETFPPQNPLYFVHKRPHRSSKGVIDADSYNRNVSTRSICEKSNNISLCSEVEASTSRRMKRLDRHRIPPGEKMNVISLFQNDGVWKEGREMEEVEGWRGTAPKKGLEEESEILEGESDILEGESEILEGESDILEGESETLEEERDISEEESETLECCHCGNVSLTKVGLVQHMRGHGFHNSYVCDVCGKSFKRNSNLKSHILTHAGSKPYKCAESNKSFRDNHNLTKHTRTHTGSKLYSYAECSKSFRHHDKFKTHLKSHMGLMPFKSAECSQSFSQNINHTNFSKTHTAPKPYRCAECSKCFRLKQHLKKHMLIHTGIKPYKCVECSKSFRRSDTLTVHMRTHTGYKPYKCAICTKSFIDNSGLTKHMRLHRF